MRALPNRRSVDRAPAHGGSSQVLKPVAHFMMHVLEMCVVMCVGLGLLSLLVFGAAGLLGYSDLKTTAPEASILIIAVNLAVSMVAWMRFRGTAWRPTLEMAGSSIVVGVLMVAASWLDVASTSSLIGVECALACVAMVAVMLFHARLYTGQSAAHARAG